jgi:hypothetical protein
MRRHLRRNDVISREAFGDLSRFSADLWKKRNKELLSCFRVGDGGLWETISAYMSTEPTDPDILAAMDFNSDNPDWTMMTAVERSYDRAFLTLWDRGALDRLLVEDEIPEQAQRDMNRIQAAVEAAKPAPPKEVVVPVAPVDPIELCVREFHEMGSDAFKKKYLDNRNHRAHYEAAIAAGKI